MAFGAMLPYTVPVLLILSIAFFYLLKAVRSRNQDKILFYKTLCSVMFWLWAILWAGQSGNWPDIIAHFMMAGFTLSIMGDVFMVFTNAKCFIGGLASFLLTHICFSAAFIIKYGFSSWNMILLLLIVLIAVIIINNPKMFKLGVMRIPAHLYLIILSFMLANAASGALFQTGFSLMPLITFVGAFLFFISDFALAYGKFSPKHEVQVEYLVLSTYYAAQLLLGFGMLARISL